MCNTPEDLDLNGIDTVAVDIETYDPNLKTKGLGAIRRDGFICGIAVATGKDTSYFPLRHSDTDINPQRISKIWDVLNEKIFQNEKITKVFHNPTYIVHCIMKYFCNLFILKYYFIKNIPNFTYSLRVYIGF